MINTKPKKRKRQRGVALLIALFTVTVVSFLAIEMSYDASVEYVVTNNEYRKLKAYYAAKAGLELSLLRILLYRKVRVQYGENLKGQSELVDKIWNFPFLWPPTVTEDVNSVEADAIGEAVGESLMDVQYITTIQAEGTKIDVNDLASPSEALRVLTKRQLTKLFTDRIDQDDELADELRNFDYETLINNIKDWVDEDSDSENGGDEGSGYSDIEDGDFPPNQEFRTMDEVRMVSGMTDKIYAFLKPSITVYGIKGINPNYASSEILQSINEEITPEVAAEVIAHRNDPDRGPFADKEAFFAVLERENVDTQLIEDAQVPLFFDAVYNFRVESIGVSGKVQKRVEAVVYDVDVAASRLADLIPEEEDPQNPDEDPDDLDPNVTTTTTTSTITTTTKPKPPKGRPNIIYYNES